MSYLARLKQQISSDAPRCEATKVSKGAFVPFVAPVPEPSRDIFAINTEQWREFESLLAIVAPAYKTPENELDEIRAAAKADLSAAILAYRTMANHIKGN